MDVEVFELAIDLGNPQAGADFEHISSIERNYEIFVVVTAIELSNRVASL
jgi:hypothetical protein